MTKTVWTLYDEMVRNLSRTDRGTDTDLEQIRALYRTLACGLFTARMGIDRLEERMAEEGGLRPLPGEDPCGGSFFTLHGPVSVQRLSPEEEETFRRCLAQREREDLLAQAVAVVQNTWKKVLAVDPEHPERMVELEPRVDGSRTFSGGAVLIGLRCAPEYDADGMLIQERETRRQKVIASISRQLEEICEQALGAKFVVVPEDEDE